MALLLTALRIYYRSLFVFLWPLVLLPIILLNNLPQTRCLFIISLMVGYWLVDALPMAMTGLIPVILFPLMNVMASTKSCEVYLSSMNELFIGGVAVALAVERSNLHRRIFLKTLHCCEGFTERRFHLVVFIITALFSMWMPNVMAARIMVELLEPLVQQLEAKGACLFFEKPEGEEVEEEKKPTKLGVCLYVSVAYAAAIGGVANLTGTPTNLALKGVYMATYKNSEDITFNKILRSNLGLSLILALFVWLWMQVRYLNLCRRKVGVVEEKKQAAKEVVEGLVEELGPITFYEVLVIILFLVMVVLVYFRWPNYMKGWPEFITKEQVGDECPTIIVVVLLFILPASLDFLHSCSKDEEKRPKAPMPSLMVWRYIHNNVLWEFIFVLGGGFSISKALIDSGVGGEGGMMQGKLNFLSKVPPEALTAVLALVAIILTQFITNVVVASIMLPFLPHVAQKIGCHPVLLMMPVDVACSFSYCFRFSSPTNQKVAEAGQVKTKDFLSNGVLLMVVSFVLLMGSYSLLGFHWDLKKMPEMIVKKKGKGG